MIKNDKEGVYPLSSVQSLIFWDQEIDSESPHYNIGQSVELIGDIKLEDVSYALNRVANRHDALRLSICREGVDVYQTVRNQVHIELEEIDARSWTEGEIKNHIKTFFNVPFKLYGSLLWKPVFLRLEDRKFILVMKYHHIIADGTGVCMVVEKILQTINGRVLGKTVPNEDEFTYIDYINDDQKYLNSARFSKDKEFWFSQLRTIPESVLGNGRKELLSSDVAGFKVSRKQYEAIKTYASAFGCSIAHFAVCLAAMYFARVSRLDEIVIGFDVHNRPSAKFKRTVGMFSSIIPLKISMDSSKSFSALMKDVAAYIRKCYRHQRFPVAELNRELRLVETGRKQLFDIMVSFENFEFDFPFEAGSYRIERMFADAEQIPFNMTIRDYHENEDVVFGYEYNKGAFNRYDIEKIHYRLMTIIDEVLDEYNKDAHLNNEAQPISDLPLVSPQERASLLSEACGPQDATLYEKTWLTLFKSQVQQSGDKVVAEYQNQTVTFSQLDQRSTEVATRLIMNGVSRGDVVALLGARSIDFLVSIIAVMKAGAAYLPLDPAHPSKRWLTVLNEAKPAVLLITDSMPLESRWLARNWDKDKVTDLNSLVKAEAKGAELENAVEEVSRNCASSDEQLNTPAYVIYTSGTTGKPKGVVIDQRGMINNMCSKFEPLSLGLSDVVAQTASQCFDISVWQFLIAPILGAKVVILQDEVTRDPEALIHEIEQRGVTLWEPVPAMIKAVADIAGGGQSNSEYRLSRLRWVLSTGEALTRPVTKAWFQSFPNIPIMNAYGPAECSDDVAFKPITSADEDIVIGRPIANAKLYVLDPSLSLLPDGAIGELAISGPVVGKGYLHSPELTREVFKPNPYRSGPHDSRIYLSGDLVRRLPNGDLEYIGRKDHQVKLRGFRIELAEIEGIINTHSSISESVVVLRDRAADRDVEQHIKNSDGQREMDETLVAYLVCHTETHKRLKLLDDVRERIRAALPPYMMPGHFVVLDALPRNENGKVNRAALPIPDYSQLDERHIEPPRGVKELILSSSWKDLLHHKDVGRNESFFDLGGHSILIIKLIEELRIAGYRLCIQDIFDTPTLKDLAEKMHPISADTRELSQSLIPVGCNKITPAMLPLVDLQEADIETIVSKFPGGAENIQDIYPLAPLQEGIHFHHVMNKNGDTYITPILIALDSREKLDGFVKALQKVADRHDILRTSIFWRNLDKPVQVVARHVEIPTVEIELDSDRNCIEQLKERTHISALQMDLEQGPLMRLSIAQDPHSETCYLIFNEHHIISDHVSLENELAEIQAIMRGEEATLPVPVPYREFVSYSIEKSKSNSDTAYFAKKLGDITEPTAPYGLFDVYGDGSGTEEKKIDLNSDIAKRLRKQAQLLGVSPASIFHVAWGLVLANTAGNSDVVFGTLMSGRLQGTVGADRMLGFTINLLPLRLQFQNRSVKEIVEQTKAELVELIEFELAPLATAQRCSGLPGSVPLFNAMLNYRHTDLIEEVNGWEGFELISAEELTNYPLEMVVDDLDDGFRLEAHIDKSVGASRILSYYHQALTSIVLALEEDADKPALALDILDETEKKQLIHEYNNTRRPEFLEKTWMHHFAYQVNKKPKALAAECCGKTLTYQELDEASTQQALKIRRKLAELGVERGGLVALLDDRGLNLLVSMIAILKSGAAYIPLDPSHPSQRWLDILNESKPELLIVGDSLAVQKRWLERKSKSCRLIASGSNLESFASETQLPNVCLDDLAYIIYTSGSTGKPKGVMIEHKGMINNMLSKVEPLELTDSDCIAQTASQCFDISVWQFLTAPILGAKVNIFPDDITRDPKALLTSLAANQVSIWEAVPSMIQAVLLEPQALPALRWVLPTGEALTEATVNRWFDTYPNIPLMNAYGPAECSDDVAFEAIHQAGRDVTIGRPLPNVRLHVVDSQQDSNLPLRLLPHNVIGELAISGPVVGRGYLNRDDLTSSVFKRNPFCVDEDDQRLYLTGDLVKRLNDGRLKYVGRKDFQVKIRGHRIELGEIESKLCSVESIQEAVVVAHADDLNETRLVAYCSTKTAESKPNMSDVKTQLKSELPDYMIPSAFVFLERLPLTANGKVDRKALPDPDFERQHESEFSSPETATEIQLADIWKSILGLSKVGREFNFFDVGGHSLLAVRLVAQVQHKFDVAIALHDVFAQPVLRDLAEKIDYERTSTAHTSSAIHLLRLNRSEKLPVSWAQQRLLFIDQLDESSNSAYHMLSVLNFNGKLDYEILAKTLRALVERHESLRTTFYEENGCFFQNIVKVEDLAGIDFAIVDMIDQDTEIRADKYQSQLNNFVESRFDLENGPLVRFRLFKTEERQHKLVMNMHHIITDGWSESVLISEFKEIYRAFFQTQLPKLPMLAFQYADYAYWQVENQNSEILQGQSRYWHQELSGAPELLSLPLDNARPVIQQHSCKNIRLRLNSELSQKLRKVSQDNGTTLFMTLLTGWAILLSKLSGQADVVVGVPSANRPHKEFEGIVGLFLNTLAMRFNLADNPDIKTLLARSKTTVVNAFANQDLPFEKVIDALNPERSLSHSPIFQSLFSMDNTKGELLEGQKFELSKGVEFELEYLPTIASQFDISLFIEDSGDEIYGLIEYADALFYQNTIERWVTYFENILTMMVELPSCNLGAVSLLNKKQQHEMLVESMKTEVQYLEQDQLDNTLIHHLFEQQVEASGNNTALIYGKDQISYRELDRLANILANFLLSQEVGPDTPVGVFMDRSVEMVVALLAVLKAGGAYVPIDPEYPQERINFILEDAAPSIVLTQNHYLDALKSRQVGVKTVQAISRQWLDGYESHKNKSDFPNACKKTNKLGAKSLAYIIYTSGSTGRPKGVMNEHQAVVNRLLWMKEELLISDDDRILQKTPYSFDVSVWEFFLPLISGATLVVAEPGGHKDPSYLNSLIEDQKITVLHFVPSMLSAFLAASDNFLCRSLKSVVCSGEELPLILHNECLRRFPQARLFNLYGPTEAAIDVTYWPCRSDSSLARVPIGLPIANIQIYILDGHNRLCPPGVVGEIHIGGIGLARGYLNQPSLTNEKFIANPLLSEADCTLSERLYKTGDLGRLNSEGAIEYLGRNDFQVKIRGFRIELGEIEARLLQQAEVAECVVTADNEYKRLIAYVVVQDSLDGNTVLEGLKASLAETLPAHMIPSVFVLIDEMPLSNNGKVDRKALPKPELGALSSSSKELPRTKDETQLCNIWKSVLSIETIGIDDNFFSIGGDSILSIQIVARAAREGLSISVRDIFEAQTLRKLAQKIKGPNKVHATQGAVTGSQVLLPIQKQLLDATPHFRAHFNQSVLLSCPDNLSVDGLRAIASALYSRHDILRLSLDSAEPGYLSVETVASLVDRAIQSYDLSGLGGAEWELRLKEVGEHTKSQISVDGSDFFRAVLLEGDRGRRRLLLVMHHMVVDAVSWQTILQDVQLSYRCWCDNKTLTLPRKTTSFQQWGEFLQQYSYSQNLAAERAYWLQMLDCGGGKLPADTQATSAGHAYTELTVRLSQEQTAKLLNECSSMYHAKTDELLISALYLGLQQWIGTNTFIIDMEGHGRENLSENIDLSQTVGWFTTVYPVRLGECTDKESALDSIIRVLKEQLRSVPNRGIGFGCLLELKGDAELRNAYQAAKPEVLFNYLGRLDNPANADGDFEVCYEDSGSDIRSDQARSHKLEVTGFVSDSRLNISISYDRNAYRSKTMETLLGRIQSNLNQLILCAQGQVVKSYVPSDFPFAKVSQKQLDQWFKAYPSIEHVYPSTEMQQAMFYHSDQDSSAYINQVVVNFAGACDFHVMSEAWRYVFSQNEILRSIFVEQNQWQLILNAIELPISTLDLSSYSFAEQSRKITYMLSQERSALVDQSQLPLMRVLLIRESDENSKMVWTHHHALLDGWSLPIIFKDLMESYKAICEQREPALGKPVSYGRYIEWRNHQDKEKLKSYWAGSLKDCDGATELGLEKQVISTGKAQPSECELRLSRSLTDSAAKLARECQVTLSTVIQGAWAYLLSKYSGEPSVLFGETVSGRSPEIEQVEQLVGLFISTLPVYVSVNEDQILADWLKSLHEHSIERSEHAALPLSDIQSVLRSQKKPLFSSIVVFENYPIESVLNSESSTEGVEIPIVKSVESVEHTHFEFTLTVIPGDELEFKLGFDQDVYTKESISAVLQHLHTLLCSMISSANKSLKQLTLVSDDEQQKLLNEWNSTRVEYDQSLCAYENFEAQVLRCPNAIAVSCAFDENQNLTYKELDDRANQVAHYLVEQGVGPDALVGLCAERSLEMVIGIYGVLKAGGAYVPLDPDYPPERVNYILKDCKAPVVLTQKKFSERILSIASASKVTCLDDDAFHKFPNTRLPKDKACLDSNNLAYVIYTSGSTGHPKGVLCEHRGLVNRIDWMQNEYGMEPSDKVLQKTPYSFDVSVWEFIWPLSVGAELVLAEPGRHGDPEYLRSVILHKSISILHFVPSMLSSMLKANKWEDFDSVRHVFCSGEALSQPLVKEFMRCNSTAALHNLYGPTEASIDVSYWACKDWERYSGIPIGQPIQNIQLYVLDKNRELVPQGVIGELYIGGDGLARGYLHNKALTNEAFIPNPFSTDVKSRLYRTGDLVRWLPDGNLKYIGRTDHQVKVRGFRVELGEIDSALLACEGVAEAVVVARDEPKRLVAYFVSDQSGKSEAGGKIEILRKKLGKTLPRHMVPSLFIELDTMPLSKNGKIDRKALPEPDSVRQAETLFSEAVGEDERTMLSLWQKKIAYSGIGVNDDFFEHGGHSLSAIQVIAEINSHWGVSLSVKDLFEAPTVRQILELIEEERSISNLVSSVELEGEEWKI